MCRQRHNPVFVYETLYGKRNTDKNVKNNKGWNYGYYRQQKEGQTEKGSDQENRKENRNNEGRKGDELIKSFHAN